MTVEQFRILQMVDCGLLVDMPIKFFKIPLTRNEFTRVSQILIKRLIEYSSDMTIPENRYLVDQDCTF